MGFIAGVLEFLRTVTDGAQTPEVKVDRGGGDTATGYHFASPGDDSRPLPGDDAFLVRDEGSGNAQIVGYQDPASEPKAGDGEKRIYSRSVAGVVIAEVWLKSDGTIIIEGVEVKIGTSAASQFVALANLVGDQLTALKDAITAAPVTPADGGAAFKAGILSALAAWPASVAAEKVKAE